jgi:hypothetical protein
LCRFFAKQHRIRAPALFLQFSDSGDPNWAADFGAMRTTAALRGYQPRGTSNTLTVTMAASWTESTVPATTTMPTGSRHASRAGNRDGRQSLPHTTADTDGVHRNDDGSIDVEFYKARAVALHRAARARFVRALRRRARAALRNLW